MKKVKTILRSILFIGLFLMTFVFESCNSKSSTVVLTSTDSLNIFDSILTTKYNDKVLITQPVPDADTMAFRHRFHDNYGTIGYKDVWLNKNIILKAFTDGSIDGFIITPICYPTDGVASDGYSYKKDDISFMITLTTPHGSQHSAVPGGAYDFNNPCPHYPNCP